ncbi:MAG: CDP-alcohol phosphatidyltransferase family protein [Paludibacteraceae bacterium]|nr:CDP-alcohol phosphatidyltransferase family protein [Candidatus Physcocola equi]MCQ2234923.1 CDP-alcohol phosphatidyltransferase family protein [Paludibacteraceae bacterium]
MGIKKHIPNTITCLNLISGGIACVFAFHQLYFYASLAIYVGAIFDFFDGMSARLLKVSSPIGKELDSLADDITFGLAPATILFMWLSTHLPCYEGSGIPGCVVPYFCFVLAAFAALRLAKFNLDTRQTSSFIGLPTPAMSILTASIIALFDADHIWGTYDMEWLRPAVTSPIVVLAYVALLSWLMVCELPMFSLKFKNLKWQGNEPKFILLATSVLMLCIFHLAAIPAIILLFIAMSVVLAFKKK